MLKYYTKEILKTYPVEETAGTKKYSSYESIQHKKPHGGSQRSFFHFL